MKHSINRNKVVPAVVAIGLIQTAVNVVVARILYDKGADDQWDELVSLANSNESDIRAIWDESDTTGRPVLGVASAAFVQRIMNKQKGES